MGLINTRIEMKKFKKKVENDAKKYITTSDKATKSKFGIVKIGDGLDVSSGTISVSTPTT